MACLLPALLLAAAPAGCDEGDAVAVRIRVDADLTGQVTTCSLQRLEAPGPAEGAAAGVDWQARGALVASTGRFAALSGLRLGEITFAASRNAEGITVVQITVPRGLDVQWPRLLTVVKKDEREQALSTFEPGGFSKKLGATARIVVEAPGTIVSSGLRESPRGVDGTLEKRRATLTIDLTAAYTDGPPLVWHLTW